MECVLLESSDLSCFARLVSLSTLTSRDSFAIIAEGTPCEKFQSLSMKTVRLLSLTTPREGSTFVALYSAFQERKGVEITRTWFCEKTSWWLEREQSRLNSLRRQSWRKKMRLRTRSKETTGQEDKATQVECQACYTKTELREATGARTTTTSRLATVAKTQTSQSARSD